MARDTAEVIEQLMSRNIFTVLLYEIQVKDDGSCTTNGASLISDPSKTWVDSEWADNTAVFTDADGSRFIVTANTSTTITVSGTPVAGEYTVERWFYLSSHIEGINTEGKPASITYGEDEFTRPKLYIPYPVNHKMLHDHELGKFPQLQISVYNPGPEAFSAYYDLDTFDFYLLFERYEALRGNELNVIMAFMDDNGDIITSPSTANITNKFIIMSSDISRDNINFTVSSLGNFADKTIPSRVFSKATCGWIYKGDKCLYSSSDPTLTTALTRCNKLLKSHVFDSGGVTLYNSSGSGNNFVVLDNDVDGIQPITIPTEMEDYIIGSIVEATHAPYLWRVTNVSSSVLTIRSYVNSAPLVSYIDSTTNKVKVNIYEKECCFGHSDTGAITAVNPAFDEDAVRGYCKYNDLVFNGDFSNVGGGDPLTRWNSSGNITVRSGYAFAVGATSISQELYDPYVPGEDLLLETGKRLNLVFRYYGASTVDGADRYLTYRLTAEIPDGSTRWWDATAKAFQGGLTNNTILLRSYNQRLGIASYTNEQKDEIRYFKFDDYVTTVILEYGGSTSTVGNINLEVITPAGSEVTYNYISCIVHNQFERFGGFPGIPTSRFWYF